MDYEKKYKEALERANKFYNNEECRVGMTPVDLEVIFPELKESGDEKIRKAIIEFFELQDDNTTYSLVPKKDILAWLEKQGENTYNKELSELLHKVICRFINDTDIPYSDREKVSMKVLPYVERLEKQGEQRFTWSEEQIKVCQEVYADILSAKGFDLATINSELKRLKEQFKSAITLLKKQGKSESESLEEMVDNTNEVEPKFKVGDWVVTDLFNIVQIKAIDNGKYVLECTMKFSISVDYADNCWHRWTIEDAKDGDALAGKIDGDSYILIYKQIKDGWIETYGHYYDSVDRFCVPSQLFCREVNGTFRPTTKEQKEFLFQKMRKAGYEWDADKKELKKL